MRPPSIALLNQTRKPTRPFVRSSPGAPRPTAAARWRGLAATATPSDLTAPLLPQYGTTGLTYERKGKESKAKPEGCTAMVQHDSKAQKHGSGSPAIEYAPGYSGHAITKLSIPSCDSSGTAARLRWYSSRVSLSTAVHPHPPAHPTLDARYAITAAVDSAATRQRRSCAAQRSGSALNDTRTSSLTL